MTIADEPKAGKEGERRRRADILAILVLILATTLAFGAGMLAGREGAASSAGDGFWVEQLSEEAVIPIGQDSRPAGGGPAGAAAALPIAVPEPDPGPQVYMASKSGTKYYLPTCGSAKRIKEENRVWFATKDEAEAAGYEPAANCKGL